MKNLKREENKYTKTNLIIEIEPKTHSVLLNQERVKVVWSK